MVIEVAGDAYTSIATGQASGTEGIAEELVQDVWDLVVGEALREMPTARTFVDVKPKRPMARGSSITMDKYAWLPEATVTAMKAALTEEADVDATAMPRPTTVTITPAEYGAAFVLTRKLRNRVFAPVDSQAARTLADGMNRVVDALVQDAIIADTTPVYIGGGTGVNDVTATDVLTASDIRKAVTRLRTKTALPWFGQAYAALVHPHVVLDLREESGATGWRTPNEYGADQSRIWNGEIGLFEGCRFVENALVRRAANTNGTPNKVYQNYIIGRGAIAEHVVEEPHTVLGPVTDKLNRFHTIGWYGDLGFEVYEDDAIQRLISSSSLQAD